MQLNYSLLKILKLKIYSSPLFLVMFFLCPCYLMARFSYLNYLCFSLLFFLNAHFPIFAVNFLEKSPKLIKDPKGPFLQNKKIVKNGSFVTGIKIFTRNNLIISVVLICQIVLIYLSDNKFVINPFFSLTHSR